MRSLCSLRDIEKDKKQTFYPEMKLRHMCWPTIGQSIVDSFVPENYEKVAPRIIHGGGTKVDDGIVVVMSKKAKKAEKVKSLIAIMPEGVRSVDEVSEWEEIDMAVDSGATESVVGEEMLTNVEIKEGEATRRGVQYEVASGSLIPNLGEKKFVAVDEQGVERSMTVQVCDVNKPLLSAHKIVQAGNKVVLSKRGRYVEDEETGEKMYLKEVGGMYMLKLWARKTFPWQGSSR